MVAAKRSPQIFYAQLICSFLSVLGLATGIAFMILFGQFAHLLFADEGCFHFSD